MTAFAPTTLIASRYRVDRILGQGGMGVVLLAHDERAFDQPVAIKVVRGDFTADDRLARFEREAALTARLSSPHVVRLREFGRTADGAPFIVMDYLEGEALSARLKREGKLPLHLAARVVDEVLAGLGDIHAIGVLHRDVKPGNVFLESSASVRDHVRLIDLGIARAAPGQDDDTALTQERGVAGTPTWLSPEVVRGETVTASADLYAAALLLLATLGAELPHERAPADTPQAEAPTAAFLHRRATSGPVQVSSLAGIERLPPALLSVIQRALAPTPAARYPDARAFRAALREALPNAPLVPLATTPRPSPTAAMADDEETVFDLDLAELEPIEPPRAPTPRRPWLAVIAALALVTAALLVYRASTPAPPAEGELARSPSKAGKTVEGRIIAKGRHENATTSLPGASNAMSPSGTPQTEALRDEKHAVEPPAPIVAVAPVAVVDASVPDAAPPPKPKSKPKPKPKARKAKRPASCQTRLVTIGRQSAKGSMAPGSPLCTRIVRLARDARQGRCKLSAAQRGDLSTLNMMCDL